MTENCDWNDGYSSQMTKNVRLVNYHHAARCHKPTWTGTCLWQASPHVKKGLMDEWMDQWNGMIGMYTEKKREGDIDG
jgi:hypothetical protein